MCINEVNISQLLILITTVNLYFIMILYVLNLLQPGGIEIFYMP